jgi:hypothetical protein
VRNGHYGDNADLPMGSVCPNRARIGHAGRVRLRWGRAWWVLEAGWGSTGCVHCGDVCTGCRVAISLGDSALGHHMNRLRGRDEAAKQAGCGFGAHQGGLGLGRAKIARIGDGTD